MGKVTSKETSLVDYLIVSGDLFPYITEFEVIDFDPLFSDIHCRLHFNLSAMLPDDLLDKNNSSNVPSKHIRWIGDKRDPFVDSVESILTIDNLSNQLDTLDIANENFQTDLNELVESLNKVFLDSAIENFGNKPVKINRNSKHHQPWFNEQCRVKRNDFHQAKKKHNLFKTEESRYDLKIASKAYKTVMNESYEEWADQKEIPYYKATSLLPTDMKFCANDVPTFSTTVLKYENLEFETEKLIQYLNLTDVPDVSLQLLTSKYIVMLDLPGELHGFVINLIQPELRKEDDRRYNDMLAMGYIVTTLQLLLGLDDSTERELSNIAIELNSIFHNKYNMFVWSDWTTHISKKIKASRTNISDESRNIKDTKKFIEDFILFDKDKKYNAAHYKRDRTRRPETQDALLRPLETLNKTLHSTTGISIADADSDNDEYNPNLESTLADFFLNPEKELTEQTNEKSSDFNFKSSTLKFITQPFSFQDDLDKLNLSRLSMHTLSADDSDQEPERSDIDLFETPKKKRKEMARSCKSKDIDEHESEKLMQLINRLGEIQESNIKVDRKKKYHELVYQAKAYQWLIKTCSDMMACSTDILNKKVIEVQNILFRHWDRSQWRRKKKLITLLKK
ncbi:unnamed protein product [Mytilus coruscus]|uniref:Rrn7/TAF1B C-terminal cyclin domain-containing protein n=1 Tax=Mytilus coruscus TaxID=42192 RepID=A0A6J8ADH6_MYTCO|nr:unnamed protein product [Mytilus coruscus]